MKLEAIDLLMPEKSQYDAIHAFTESIYHALQKLSYKCRLIPVEEHFTTPLDDPADLTLAVNGIPSDEDGLFLCERSGVPHLAYLIDPPYRYLHLLSSPLITVANDDANGCRLLERYGYPALFIPHGVDKEIAGGREQERDIDLLFMATYIDYERRAALWGERYSTVAAKAMREAAEQALYDDCSCFMEAFEEAYNRLLRRGSAEAGGVDLVELLTDLELYIKGRSRVELVKAVKELPLLLFNGSVEKGYGWEHALGDDYPNINLHQPVYYKEGLEFLKRSKIVLNSFIKNKEGAHDRIFNGMASGACLVTNETRFMKEHFTHNKELLFYQPWNMAGVEEMIGALLADKSKLESMAKAGREEVLKNHTWERRFEAALKKLVAP